jgi:hypothetical protein
MILKLSTKGRSIKLFIIVTVMPDLDPASPAFFQREELPRIKYGMAPFCGQLQLFLTKYNDFISCLG